MMRRWSSWWAAGCIALAVFVYASGESCRQSIIKSEECSSLGRWAYDSANEAMWPLLIVAIVGGVLLGKIQDHVESRPCPRCGRRLAVGQVKCECGFDTANYGRET